MIAAPTSGAKEAASSRSEPFSYAQCKYWDDRYREKAFNFDWFFNYGALKDLFLGHILSLKRLPCLHVGCGNSNIQEGLVRDGFVEVVNTDFSPAVIQQMLQQHADIPALRYLISDCRTMPEFGNASFGSVIDKGTLDAVLCASHGQQDTFRYLREVDRVLVSGGIFLVISLGSPVQRLELFTKASLNWDIEVSMVPKPIQYLQSESSLSGRAVCSDNTNDKDDPVALVGPFLFSTYDKENVVSVARQHKLQPMETVEQHMQSLVMNKTKAAPASLAAAAMMEGIEHKDHFYFYACRKHEGTSSEIGLSKLALANNTSDSPMSPEILTRMQAAMSLESAISLEPATIFVGSPTAVEPAASVQPATAVEPATSAQPATSVELATSRAPADL